MARQHHYLVEMTWANGSMDGDMHRKMRSALRAAKRAFNQDPSPVYVTVSRVQNDFSRGKKILACTRRRNEIRCSRR